MLDAIDRNQHWFLVFNVSTRVIFFFFENCHWNMTVSLFCNVYIRNIYSDKS